SRHQGDRPSSAPSKWKSRPSATRAFVVTTSAFTLEQPRRYATMLVQLAAVTEHHRRSSPAYNRILNAIGHGSGRRYASTADFPWLPVRLFKTLQLRSIPDEDVFRVLTYSGTTGDVSRIYLDREAAATQA